jgi:hypothetical protein
MHFTIKTQFHLQNYIFPTVLKRFTPSERFCNCQHRGEMAISKNPLINSIFCGKNKNDIWMLTHPPECTADPSAPGVATKTDRFGKNDTCCVSRWSLKKFVGFE